MAHELTLFANAVGVMQAEMAYSGAKPWHGLGQEVTPGASIEEWLNEANMNWKYERATVQYQPKSINDSEPAIQLFDQSDVIYRSDNLAPLSVVSDRYKTVQPFEVVDFFRSLVAEEGFEIETLGSLKGGRRIWAMAKTNIVEEVNAGDQIKANLLLVTSCDGSLATTAKFVSTRVVCWNTQAIALGEEGKHVKVRHNSEFDANAVKGQMGLMGRKAFKNFMANMETLSRKQVSTGTAMDLIAHILPKPAVGDVRETRGFKSVLGLFHGSQKGYNLPGVSGTAWGILNAITEYTDHHVRARSEENRLNASWFGAGAKLKATAEETLLEFAN
jgi:phage/plasmid-like protein (TIGR03299 family)